MKVGKEEIIGVLAAVEAFVKRDEAASSASEVGSGTTLLGKPAVAPKKITPSQSGE